MCAHTCQLKIIMKTLIGLGLGGLLIVILTPTLSADSPKVKKRQVSHVTQTQATKSKDQTPLTASAADIEPSTIDVLKGIQTGQLSVTAEGTGDGRITMSLTNRTNNKLRVVLPPGLIVSGATGQFGGGMGGMGGGMGGGGMGGGMGGGGMGGGMGGGGMGGGGMGGGGMTGGMGGSRGGMGGGMGGGTMPASMGMMMLGRLIMSLVGERDSWNQASLMSGMMGGMGGGMGGMGGGMRSVPPTGLLTTSLDPHQVRHLPTSVVSLNGPGANALPLAPAKGERLQISGIDQATEDSRTRTAVKRLAEAKAPQTVAQMVLWYVTAGADWDDIGRLSQGWGNAHEIALARQFVEHLDQSEVRTPQAKADPGPLYFEIKAEGDHAGELATGLRTLWGKYPVLGLTAKEGIPESPKGPALACQLELSETAIVIKLTASHPSGSDWINLGRFQIKASEMTLNADENAKDTTPLTSTQKHENGAARLGDAVAEAIVARLVRVQLTNGPKDKGKSTFQIKIVNESPMILNGLALGGSKVSEDNPPSVLAGLSVPPLKSLTVGGSAELVKRLHMKDGVRVFAADLSGL